MLLSSLSDGGTEARLPATTAAAAADAAVGVAFAATDVFLVAAVGDAVATAVAVVVVVVVFAILEVGCGLIFATAIEVAALIVHLPTGAPLILEVTGKDKGRPREETGTVDEVIAVLVAVLSLAVS